MRHGIIDIVSIHLGSSGNKASFRIPRFHRVYYPPSVRSVSLKSRGYERNRRREGKKGRRNARIYAREQERNDWHAGRAVCCPRSRVIPLSPSLFLPFSPSLRTLFSPSSGRWYNARGCILPRLSSFRHPHNKSVARRGPSTRVIYEQPSRISMVSAGVRCLLLNTPGEYRLEGSVSEHRRGRDDKNNCAK